MLTKLLKYDFKSLFKSLIPIYLIALLLAVFQKGFMFLSDKMTIFQIPGGFITGFYVVVLIALPIATFIFSIIKYYNNLCKDEGYLMHTLPVKKSSLVLSKLIVATIAMFTTVVVMGLCGFISFLGSDIIKQLFDLIIYLFGQVDTLLLVLVGLSILIGSISQQLMVYLSISLGQTKNSKKVLFSIIYGIVIYNIVQIIVSLLVFVPSFINEEFYNMIFNNVAPSVEFLNTYLIFAILINVVISVIYYISTYKILDKKLNLE